MRSIESERQIRKEHHRPAWFVGHDPASLLIGPTAEMMRQPLSGLRASFRDIVVHR